MRRLLALVLLLPATGAHAQIKSEIDKTTGRIGTTQPDNARGVRLVCRNDTTPPTIADGTDAAVRCNASGELITTPGTTAITSTNLEQLDGVNLAPPVNVNTGGTENVIPVNLRLTGGTGSTEAGTISSPLRTAEVAPTGITFTPIDPNQAGAIRIAANALRVSLLCQSVGTEPAMFRVGSNTAGGTIGLISAGDPSGPNLGGGGTFVTSQTGAIFIYDLLNNGLADQQCAEETL